MVDPECKLSAIEKRFCRICLFIKDRYIFHTIEDVTKANILQVIQDK
jgi:hypothetical protein